MNNFQLWQAIGAVAGGFGVFFAGWYTVVTRPILKQLSGMALKTQVDEVNRRLQRIEEKLDNHSERIVRLEERTSPLHR